MKQLNSKKEKKINKLLKEALLPQKNVAFEQLTEAIYDAFEEVSMLARVDMSYNYSDCIFVVNFTISGAKIAGYKGAFKYVAKINPFLNPVGDIEQAMNNVRKINAAIED